jgi:hypothetical protein
VFKTPDLINGSQEIRHGALLPNGAFALVQCPKGLYFFTGDSSFIVKGAMRP